MHRQIVSLVLFSVLVAALTGCGPKAPEPTPEESTRVHVGDMAPDFEALSMEGTRFSLEEQRGKVVVLSFFATWCPPCRKEIPHLEQEVWRRFKGLNFSMAAIAREHEPSELSEFISQMGMTFPVVPDPDREIFSLYADAFIPRTVVIDPDGRVIYHAADFKPDEFAHMVELIEQAVGANAPSDLESSQEPTADELNTDS